MKRLPLFAAVLCSLSSVLCTPSSVVAATPIAPVPPQANFRVAVVQVRVAPDHRDWTYKVSEPAKFRVTVTADNEPIDNATISYTVGPELMPAETKTVAVPLEGVVIDGGTLKEPGFIRCNVSTEVTGRTYKGSGTAAFSPEKIVPYQTEPADFDAFWQKGKDELAKIPMDAKLTLLPDACTDKVNVYHVSFRTYNPLWSQVQPRIFGILCEPKKPGKYPAILRVPGAGVRPYSGDKDMAERGVITLEIGIHGIPVNMAKEIYDAMYSGALSGYWFNNFDNKDTYYYRRVYLGCIRANDFLASREMWDGKNLLVIGASQGGQLSIVTAALDPRVTGLSATHPAGCDLVGELHGRAGGWPHPFKPDEKTGVPVQQATPEKIATTTYYDTVNFARRIKVPGFYIWGYNDETCPPTSTHAMYNVVTAPKELALEFEQAHTYPVEQQETINAWAARALGLK
ncbi:MAG TPA: acetylxylan esterase [Candidatus Didemnitutus sp.]|nr:acetylxylan esterase [Candidatus Didemnitutus sp.]